MKKQKHPEIDPNYKHHTDFYHPPLLPMPDIPVVLHYGAYGVKRRFDVHTGVDLYAPEGSEVYAIEKGEIVQIRPFTGEKAGCPHWNETWCVDIEGYTGTLGYGEVIPLEDLKVGDTVEKGQLIAHVTPVLKEDKGKAMSMLHFSIHSHGWHHLVEDAKNPEKESFYDLQRDPTMLLLQLKAKADLMEKGT
jgi:murein DD-endopeptidase MepM/ murein hydrolase activator NlpD